MNKKQLAEMIKSLRKKKLDEIIGKPEKFNPKHKTTHPEDPTSPNQPFSEERLDELGPTHAANLVKRAGVISKMPRRRKKFQGGNQMRRPGSYTEETELGATETGKKGKESEDIDVNPTIRDNTSLNKNNTTIKELKEK